MSTTRINQYLAAASDLSRRSADTAIAEGRVTVNGQIALVGQSVGPGDTVTLDGRTLEAPATTTIALNKPVGCVCSRRQQGNTLTIYSLLPPEYQHLNSVGRLDKDSSGLILLTNDGYLAERLTHPSYGKSKRYELVVRPGLKPAEVKQLEAGIELEDGPSKLTVEQTNPLIVSLTEGRNRQIRRTFEAINHEVTKLHRLSFGPIELDDLKNGQLRLVTPEELA
jgi:23S rRNA pseudouridine2605 synthase